MDFSFSKLSPLCFDSVSVFLPGHPSPLPPFVCFLYVFEFTWEVLVRSWRFSVAFDFQRSPPSSRMVTPDQHEVKKSQQKAYFTSGLSPHKGWEANHPYVKALALCHLISLLK